jgi:ABC-type phosphate transport system auxiliary subunit
MARTELLQAALALPQQERADLARELLQSLDREVDPGAARAWVAEIERRAQQVAEGSAVLADRDDAFRRVSTRLKERREDPASR